MDIYLKNKSHRGSNGVRALSTILVTDTEGKRKHRKRGRGAERKNRKKRAGKRRTRRKTDRLATKYVRIAYWNCRSMRQRSEIIQKIVYDFDILLLQEAHLREADDIECPGYICYKSPIGPSKVGLVTYVNHACLHGLVDIRNVNNANVELLAIDVMINDQEWRIFNTYVHVDSIITDDMWDFLYELSNKDGRRCLIAGDFNARSREWGNEIENRQGVALSQALLNTDLICLNDGRPTRLATRTGDTDGVIDLALISAAEAPMTKFDVLTEQDSDHLPCVVLICKNHVRKQIKRKKVFRYSIEDKSSNNILHQLRRNALQKTTKTDTVQPPWWTEAVNQAWVVKETATKIWQRARKNRSCDEEAMEVKLQDKKRATNNFKATAKEAKNTQWEIFVTQMGNDGALHKFWTFHKKMNRVLTANLCPPISDNNGRVLTTDEDKGRGFLNRYITQSDKGDRDSRVDLSERYRKDRCNDSYVDLVTEYDVRQALRRSKNTAPGPDGVQYHHMTQLDATGIQSVVKEFNASIQRSVVPPDWLHGYLHPLPKPRKDPSLLSSYRIITLQNVYGKLLEKIVARKLCIYLEAEVILPDTLGSYRPGKMTWGNAATFAYDVYEGFQHKMETVAVALDLEDAYNRVDFAAILAGLEACRVNPWLIGWIGAALLERTVALRFGQWTSEPTNICTGLPQGSPLSPILFNIYTSVLARITSSGLGRVLTYADDILIYNTGSNRQQLCQNVQETLQRVSEWCEDTGSSINPNKACVMWCSLNNNIGNVDLPDITWNAQTMERADRLTYLGITFDRSLSFKHHIDSITQKAKRGLTAVKTMAAKGLDQRLLVILYNQLVNSVLDYGLGILTISNTQCEKLERIQNEGMRTILGCTRDTPIATMRYMLGWSSIRSRYMLAQVRAYMGVIGDVHHPLHENIGEIKGARLKRGRSWMASAEALIKEVTTLDVIPRGAEWTQGDNTYTQVIITLGRECREWCDGRVDLAIHELIDSHAESDDAVVYTDGSVIRGRKSGWGFSARMRGRICAEQSGAYQITTSSMRMEVEAVTAALRWLSTTPVTKAIIVSDSQSMLRKVQNGYFWHEWTPHVALSQLQELVWIYCPGHAGVRGNERADSLATKAPIIGTTPLGRTDIIRTIRDHLMKTEQAIEESTRVRLSEWGVGFGTSNRDRKQGRIRRVTNQCATGTISIHTLRYLLGVTERLWACPECRDVDS